ncbi:MAG TPA: PepSY domain-containing protein [Candidatus Mediterraneibacter gallistercoris]|uniref:PepSY domain-containing protein n=1 Tax=Candidatus Mediterraneibacter gallistercoris TaxID=2838671 RepID=A0A9D2P445_9FIRM|nr:PepSY domain-containing protein [Candidatus Mediterraneibacter gallistercoris]
MAESQNGQNSGTENNVQSNDQNAAGTTGQTGSNSGTQDIGEDAALQAALEAAGISEADASRIQVSRDRDDGREVYDVRFDAGQTEYDYEVLASDGQIISSDVERRDDDRNNGNNTDVAVSREKAIDIALAKVAGASDNDIRIELDYDDGRYKYEGDIIYERVEYDFEIDANTGDVLEWSEERD